jgi:hypothetical protein
MLAASSDNSLTASLAALTSFAASMISTYAASTLNRVTRSCDSSIMRRIPACAASTRPWASRNSAMPGWGWRPTWLACRYAASACTNSPRSR